MVGWTCVAGLGRAPDVETRSRNVQQQQGSASPASQLAVSSSGPRESSAILSHATSLGQPALRLLCLPRSFVSRSSANQTLLFSIPNWSHNNVETTHTLFHQMTFLSPRPPPPYKELVPLGLIESDQGQNCSTSSVKKARMVSVPSKAFSQTNSFVRNKSLCSNTAFT